MDNDEEYNEENEENFNSMDGEHEVTSAMKMLNIQAFCGLCKRSFMKVLLGDSLGMDKHDEDIAVTCPQCLDRCKHEGCKGKRLKDSSKGSDFCSKCQWIVEDVDESSFDVSSHPDALDNHYEESISNHPVDHAGIEEEEIEEEENVDGNRHGTDSESISNQPIDLVGIEEEEIEEEEDVDGNRKELKLLARIRGICNKVTGGMGSDGNFGSTNGEVTDASCIKLVRKSGVTHEDVFMDVGGSSGLTPLRFSAIAKCKAVIGVEIMDVRHKIALKSNIRVMEELPSIDLRTIFCHNNILDFDNFNGVTFMYMFDAAIPDTEWVYLAPKVNSSKTVAKIISSKNNLEALGFNVDMVECLGDFPCIGGHLNRTLYLYQCKNFNPECYVPNDRIANLIETAANRELRLSVTDEEDRAYSLAKDVTRTDPIRTEAITESLELYNLLTSDKPVRSTVYKKVQKLKKSSPYQVYSQTGQCRELNVTNTMEFDAFALEDTTNCNPPKPNQAIIAPSYDPDSQTILVSLLNDKRKSKYLAILYDVRTGGLAEKSLIAERSLYSCYRYQTSIPPAHLTAAVNEYRFFYPLSTDEIEKEKSRMSKTPNREFNASLRPSTSSSHRRKNSKDLDSKEGIDRKRFGELLKEKADKDKQIKALSKKYESAKESVNSLKKINSQQETEKRKLEDTNAKLSSKLQASENVIAQSRSVKKGGEVSNGSTSLAENRFHHSGVASGVTESLLNMHTSLVRDHATVTEDLAQTKRSLDTSKVNEASLKRQCVEKDSVIESLQVKTSELTELLVTAKDEQHKAELAAKDDKHKEVSAAKDVHHAEVTKILQNTMADTFKAFITFAAVQKSDTAASTFVANSNNQST